jgi:hypothetical protein
MLPSKPSKFTAAALVNYFNDIDMLEIQFHSGQFDQYDKIYIWDGPYSYTQTVDFMQINSPKLPETSLGKKILEDERFVYFYKEWNDEAEKRVSAYEAIQEDIIFIHDTDEFFNYKKEELELFIASDKSVGFFYCQNLYFNGVHATPIFYFVDTWNKMPHKGFAFKKNDVESAEHLNYLWLVGVEQQPISEEKKYKTPLANVYHFTGMRSKAGQIQKFIFYSSLHDKQLTQKNNISLSLSDLIRKGIINKSEALNIFLNSIPGFGGIHSGVINNSEEIIMGRRVPLDDLENVFTDVLSALSKFAFSPLLLIDGVSCYIFCPIEFPKLKIKYAEQISLTIWDLFYGQSSKQRGEIKLPDSQTEINQIINSESIGMVLKFVQHGKQLVKVNLSIDS